MSEGRCSVCQASRDHVHVSGVTGVVPALALLLALLVLAALVAAHLG